MHSNFIKEVGILKWTMRTARRQFYKRILQRDHSMQLPSGQHFLLPRSSKFASEAFITNGDVDWGSEALLFDLLQKRGVFLDIGANIGYYSIYMSPRATSVFSFEPDPRMIELLRRNVGSFNNVKIVQKAVGKESGAANFIIESNGEVSHLAHNAQPEKSDDIIVEVTTVDSFVADNNLDVEAIKIDVEGFDIDVVRGAIQTLRAQRPYVLTEAQATPELLSMMSDVNFRVFAFARNIKSREKSFIEIREAVRHGLCTKMLFLVPEEHEVKIKRAVTE